MGKTASALVSWMSAARILTLFLHHHPQLSSTSQSVAEETLMDLEPEFKDLLSQSPNLESGPICVLSFTQSQLSKRLDMVENQSLRSDVENGTPNTRLNPTLTNQRCSEPCHPP